MKKLHHLTSPWPSDLLKNCPSCNSELDARINISYGRFGIARILRKIAWWAPLPAFPIATVICFTFPDRGLIMAIALGTIFPSMLLNTLYYCSPIKRRLKCWKCDYEEYSNKTRWAK